MNRTGIRFFVIHGIAVLLFGILVGIAMESNGELVMLWNLWFMIDFPASLLAGLLEQQMGGFPYPGFSDISSTLILSVFLAIVGGIQYYLIGLIYYHLRMNFSEK